MSAGWSGYPNGRIPASSLLQVPGAPTGYLLRPPAAVDAGALIAMLRRRHPELRGISPFTGTYRTYQRQVELREDWCRRGQCTKAAVPGTSNHGEAEAADWRPEFWAYMQRYEAEVTAGYGWVWPAWAKRIVNGVRWESWHWEHTSGRQHSPVVVEAVEEDEMLEEGSSGAAVVDVQELINAAHRRGGAIPECPIAEDGEWGPMTSRTWNHLRQRAAIHMGQLRFVRDPYAATPARLAAAAVYLASLPK